MKRLKLFLLSAFLLCGCSGGAAPIPITETTLPVSEAPTEPAETPIPYSELLECRYFDEEEFFIYDRRGAAYPCGGEVRCGVVPHHLTAGHMISGFFKTAAQNAEPETIVIVAPMHYPSDHKLCTSETAWATPWGVMETDTEITALFTEQLGAAIDDEMLQFDH
ncbi:MAG: AmmeMemoRadiSam system protein B, partial [Ruminiclostridium sp.]|nr:AmmeMemoRadiSam system protein B [Ruminiclostridium sp.]